MVCAAGVGGHWRPAPRVHRSWASGGGPATSCGSDGGGRPQVPLAARLWFRFRGAFRLGRFPSGLEERLAGYWAVYAVRGEVGAVRPTHRAKFVDGHLPEYRFVA